MALRCHGFSHPCPSAERSSAPQQTEIRPKLRNTEKEHTWKCCTLMQVLSIEYSAACTHHCFLSGCFVAVWNFQSIFVLMTQLVLMRVDYMCASGEGRGGERRA